MSCHVVVDVDPRYGSSSRPHVGLGFPRNRGGFLIADGASHSLATLMPLEWFEGRRSDLRDWFSCGPLLSGLFGSLVEDLFVGDGGHHLTGAVAASVVVVVDEGGDLLSCLVFGGEVPAGQQFVLEGRGEGLGGGGVERR